jgi:nitrogen regulatory protein PII
MSHRELTVLTHVALVTCVVEKGFGDSIAQAAREAGAQGATIYFARGTGVRERLGVLSVAVEAEKAVVEVVAPTEMVDRIVRRMYLAGQLDTPGRGIVYVSPLEKAATYVPPEILRRLQSREERQ